jgi:hypothetical protein
MATKDDMDRIGLFKEMEYVTIKDPYKEPARCKFSCHFFCVSNHFFVEVSFNEAANKNKQMMSKCSKERSTGSMARYQCVAKLGLKKKRKILLQNHSLACIDPEIRT